jgi:hypothetical protein
MKSAKPIRVGEVQAEPYLVLYRGSLSDSLSALDADVVGDEPDALTTPSRLWPSDHAGLIARLGLG